MMIGRAVRRGPREVVAARSRGTLPIPQSSHGVVVATTETSPTTSRLAGFERHRGGLTPRTDDACSSSSVASRAIRWTSRGPPALAAATTTTAEVTDRHRRPRPAGGVGPAYACGDEIRPPETLPRRTWSSSSSSRSRGRRFSSAAATFAIASASAASCLGLLGGLSATTETSPLCDDGGSAWARRGDQRPRGPPVTFGTSIGAQRYHSTPTGTTDDAEVAVPSSNGSGLGSTSTSTSASASDSDVVGGEIPSKKEEREYCPTCVKYGRGPCGPTFNAWLECTDLHPGKDPETGEDLHLVKCDHLATRLADCLREHADFYDNDDIDLSEGVADEEDRGGEGGDGGDDLRSAWENLVDDLERERKGEADVPFPSHLRPELEVRFAGGGGGDDGGGAGTGVATFRPHSRRAGSSSGWRWWGGNEDEDEDGRMIVLAYVRYQDGILLAAGTREDMIMSVVDVGGEDGGDDDDDNDRDGGDDDGGCALRFVVSETTESVTAFALYDDDDGGEASSSRHVSSSSRKKGPVLYKRTALLPPR